MVAGHEVRMSNGRQAKSYIRVERTKAHSPGQVLNTEFGFARPDLYPTAERPRHGKIGVERQREFDVSGGCIQVTNDVGLRPRHSAQYNWIVAVQLDCLLRESQCFGYCFVIVFFPAADEQSVAKCRHPVRAGETWRQSHSLVTELARFLDVTRLPGIE